MENDIREKIDKMSETSRTYDKRDRGMSLRGSWLFDVSTKRLLIHSSRNLAVES